MSMVCATSGVARGSTTLTCTLKPRTRSWLARNPVPVPIGVASALAFAGVRKKNSVHVDRHRDAGTGFVGHGDDIGGGVDVQHMTFGAQPHVAELAARPHAHRHQLAVLLVARGDAHEFAWKT